MPTFKTCVSVGLAVIAGLAIWLGLIFVGTKIVKAAWFF